MIGLGYQMIGMLEEQQWIRVSISVVLIVGLIVQMVLGYRKRLAENDEAGQLIKNS